MTPEPQIRVPLTAQEIGRLEDVLDLYLEGDPVVANIQIKVIRAGIRAAQGKMR